MGAKKVPTPVEETEVFYVLIPPQTSRPHRWSRSEYLWTVRKSAWSERTSTAVQALIGALVWTALALLGLYCLYLLKSAIGIDLFADKHFEDFFPAPGYNRW